MVAVLAVAIGFLPASMGIATAAPTASTVAAAAQAMPDCDHHQHQHQVPVKQTQNTDDHGTCIAGCALCFGFVGADVSAVAYTVPASAALKFVCAREAISSLMGSPPFRPPRT